MGYLVGIDIGGTFTDCAIVDRAGKLLTTKVLSTPQDFSQGMMDALQTGAQALDLSLGDFCRDIAFLSHGTTVGTNTIIQKKGARVGLIAMTMSMEVMLADLGVDEDDMRSEEFYGY